MDNKETKQGSATGSVPAGSNVKQVLERAENGNADGGASYRCDRGLNS